MGLFSKKYDYKKDELYIKFDFETNTYHFYKHGSIISEDEINKRSLKELNNKRKELEDVEVLNKEREEVIKKEKRKAREKELQNMGYSCESFKVVTPVKKVVSEEIYNYLLPYLKNEHGILCIHRMKYPGEETLKDIFDNGFIMSGHGFNFISPEGHSLSENFGYYPDNMEILDEIKYANGYKNSDGSVLAFIPDEDLAKKDIFFYDKHNIQRLKSKYILGYVPVGDKMEMDTIIKPSDLLTNLESEEKTKQVLMENLDLENNLENNTMKVDENYVENRKL